MALLQVPCLSPFRGALLGRVTRQLCGRPFPYDSRQILLIVRRICRVNGLLVRHLLPPQGSLRRLPGGVLRNVALARGAWLTRYLLPCRLLMDRHTLGSLILRLLRSSPLVVPHGGPFTGHGLSSPPFLLRCTWRGTCRLLLPGSHNSKSVLQRRGTLPPIHAWNDTSPPRKKTPKITVYPTKSHIPVAHHQGSICKTRKKHNDQTTRARQRPVTQCPSIVMMIARPLMTPCRAPRRA